MKSLDVCRMVQAGKKVIVRFDKLVEELDLQFDENMMAEIIYAEVNERDEEIRFVFDESSFSKMNKDLEKPNWPDGNGENCKRFSDNHRREDCISIWESLYGDISYFVVIDKSLELVEQYLKSESSLSYVTWLEEKIYSDGLA